MNATTTMTPTSHRTPGIRLGILQAGRAPDVLLERSPDYNHMFVELLGEEAFEYRHWPVLDGVFPDSLNDADAWLITGSRFGAYEDHPWIPPLETLIRDIYALGRPMIGICFGHQIIAQALGGKVEKFTGGWSVGRVEYRFDESVFGTDTTMSNDSTALMAFHQDQVIVPPSEARNVGSSPFCKHAALLYDNRILTIQPHPEFDHAFIEGLLDTRGEILPDDVKTQARQSLQAPINRESIASTLRHFLSRDND